MHVSYSTMALYVLTLKTNNLHFLTNSSVDHGFGHIFSNTVDCHLVLFIWLTIDSDLKLLHTEIVSL